MSGKDLMLQHPFNRLLLLHSIQMKHMLKGTLNEDIEFYQDVLVNGIEDEYESVYDEVSSNSASIPKEVTKEVREIIYMFEVINHSLAINYRSNLQFAFTNSYIYSFNGFDERNSEERAHFIYLRFYMSYYDFKIPLKDANYLSLEDYRMMLETFQKYKHQSELTYDQLRDVCLSYQDINFPGIIAQ